MKARYISVVLRAGLAALCLGTPFAGSRADVASVATPTIYGKIQMQDVTSLEQSFANNKVGDVHVNSRGGDPYAAMAIGRLIRKHQIKVWADQNCFASCALVFIAGVTRYNTARIELYRPDLQSEPSLGSANTPAMDPKLTSEIRAYVAEMGVSEEFANLLMTADIKNMRTYDYKNDIRALIPRDDPTFHQAQQLSFARGYGLTVDEYQRRERDAQSCGSVTQDPPNYEKCDGPIMWGLSAETFETRNKRASTVCATEAKELADTRPFLMLPFNSAWWDDPVRLRFENCRLRVMSGG